MKVFLSYSAEDKATAEPIYFELTNSDCDVFFDRKSLLQGNDFNDQIRNAIAESDLFIFLISPASVAPGSYTLTELHFAEKRWKHPKGGVFPVMIRPTEFSDIPSYAKAVTVYEPAGNAAAEVDAWVEQFRVERRRNRHKKLAMAGGGLLGVALAATLGWQLLATKTPDEDRLTNENGSRTEVTRRTNLEREIFWTKRRLLEAGFSVSDLQQALKSAGFYHEPVDGSLGPTTLDAVTTMQLRNGLHADGICGPRCFAALGMRSKTD